MRLLVICICIPGHPLNCYVRTFQPSQLCLLNPRSNNLFPSGQDAVLSARGLHHRSKEVFAKEVLVLYLFKELKYSHTNVTVLVTVPGENGNFDHFTANDGA